MDYLSEQEGRQQKVACIDRLTRKKEELAHRLQILCNHRFDVEQYGGVGTEILQEVERCTEILDSYRLVGLSIESMSPDLVLRFGPLYGNQYPTAEHYSVQLLRKGGNYKLGKHNLPPFLPIKQLQDEHLVKSVAAFVEQTNGIVYAYVQRREGVKRVQEAFKEHLTAELDINLAVSYVELELSVSDDFPGVEVVLEYSLTKCVPDTVKIKPVDSNEPFSISKAMLDQRLEHWKQILSTCDIYTAVKQIVGTDS